MTLLHGWPTTPETAPARAGFRLDRLEMLNWGTFDRRVWTLHAGGENTLLTGDIGSGKSTVVDAITTLLLPAHRISYNKAAGAELRERDLRSYVLGHWRSERNETTGSTRQVGLRRGSTWSALIAVFRNRGAEPGADTVVTLGQVFWLRQGEGGQPERFHLVADHELSIAADLADFGSDPADLKRRLRARSGITLYPSFPDYGRAYRKRLGIESEQAMELFHQTVSMKAVSDLTGFVRSHMLEPFDAVGWIDRLVGHFDDLTRAHDAVVTARAQLEQLTPILTDADQHAALTAQLQVLSGDLLALPRWADRLRAKLLVAQATRLRADVTAAERELVDIGEQLERLRQGTVTLTLQRAGHGGDRLGRIEELLADAGRHRRERRARADTYDRLLSVTGLDPVSHEQAFRARQEEIAAAVARASEGELEAENRLSELDVALAELREQAAELAAELTSLRSRTSNVPRSSTALRQRLATELTIEPDELPFAGELMQVSPAHGDWQGAAERVLRGFALSLLVPDRHYAAVSGWIDANHLGSRVVYHHIPARPVAAPPLPPPRSLAAVVEVRPGPLAAWVETQVIRRAEHLRVDSVQEFQRTPSAVTLAGQVKDRSGRHEKDDRRRIDDERDHVLGWSNEAKQRALLAAGQVLQGRLNTATAERDGVRATRSGAVQRSRDLSQLAVFSTWQDLDWRAAVEQAADLQAERDRLVASSTALARIDNALADLRMDVAKAETRQGEVHKALGAAGQARDDAFAMLAAVRRRLGDPTEGRLGDPTGDGADDGTGESPLYAGGPVGDEQLTAPQRLDRRGGVAFSPPIDLADVDDRERQLRATLDAERGRHADDRSKVEQRLVKAMTAFRAAHPAETAELDASVEAAPEFRVLHERVRSDDLPRFEATFKEYLNQNAIRDIAGFLAELNRRSSLISERVALINASLRDIDYNPGRYIALEAQRSTAVEIADFRADLRACTDDAVGEDDQYSEARFLQVSRIVERLRGRTGHVDEDRRWSRLVTDVRNWFVFTASERWRHDDAEHETYSDSGGKSGGQKEKLAYTILAASLAYQFRIDPAVQHAADFRFVVIDEAFGRGSDESTRFALDLFGRLGLQLLIVTPLQKIHVIEPHVAAVGFVDNKDGNDSRLQNMSIEEYQERRATAAASR